MSCDGNVSCDGGNDFGQDLLRLAEECTMLITQEAENLSEHWALELGDDYENQTLSELRQNLSELRREATKQTTNSAIKTLVKHICRGNGIPSDTIIIDPSGSDTVEPQPGPSGGGVVPQGTTSKKEDRKKIKRGEGRKIKRRKIKREDRKPLQPCFCPLNCRGKIPETLRKKICTMYWEIPREDRSVEFKKNIGMLVQHDGGCGEWRETTCFLYKKKRKVQICNLMMIRTLGYFRNDSTLPPLDAVACKECVRNASC